MAYMFDDYPAQQIIVAILVCIAAVTGLLGNILVLVAVGLSRKLHNVTNAFVTSLAACNLLTCLTIPYHMATILGDPPEKLGACKFFAGVLISTQIVSLITLTLIAVLRAFLVCGKQSTYLKIYTKRNVGVMIALSWVVPFLAVFVASVTRMAPLAFNEKYSICIVETSKSGVASLVAGIVVGLPSLVIIVVCYSLIFYFIRKHHAEMNRTLTSLNGSATQKGSEAVTDNKTSHQHLTNPENNHHSTPTKKAARRKRSFAERNMSERQTKVNRNLFIVVCAFLISVLPFCIAIISPNINAAIPWCAVLLMSNSAINPVLYGFFHPYFKEVFQKIFTGKFSEIPMMPSVVSRLASNVHSSPGVMSDCTHTKSCDNYL
ncbi:Trace amine-associated receptor 7g [Holothuria leucospilota]|uniref:Trace amine-associated receptor 7g n=1 Tax=Holothuria leucospilota TaxID=206669 RepID=A0A9Q0YHY0_HOLLE|nr:Trace amine-associated receptor 7g [Holothuria leucospilota]